MESSIIERLDIMKDQVEDIWIQASSIKDSLQVFEYSQEMLIHENPKGMSAVANLYITLVEMQEQKIKHLLDDLELLLRDLKHNTASD